ncbi:MAG: DUF2460 domain-containing protein, partial [Actinobacteria bacterium]|nr:DUF2460 domain-containing protein [Actinomycetota bacterium]
MIEFLDLQFPADISYGSEFGPEWNTEISTVSSGYETRDAIWANPIYSGDVSYGVRSPEEMSKLIHFFHEARGQLIPFRFKDWQDYTAEIQPLQIISPTKARLIKVYGSGAN